MAKRERNKRGQQAEASPSQVATLAQVQGVLKTPSAEQLTTLVLKLNNLETKRKLVSDSIKESIEIAKETQHLDPLALAIGRRLDKLPDEKLAVTLPHLLKYIDDMGLEKRATAQGEMFEPESDELAGQTDLEDAIVESPQRPALRIVDETGVA